MNPPVVELDRVTISHPGGPPVFRDFSWTIREGETWAITGPVGSGKTTLAETLLGKHPAPQGDIRWPILERLRAAGRVVNYPTEVIHHVAFKEESRLFSYVGHYYQQRFEFADADEPLTLAEFLRSGTSATEAEVIAAAHSLGVAEQLPLSFIKLSNGQTRRARIARALLSKPELLILDDPFIGLDTSGREHLTSLLGELVRSALRLVLVCRPDAVPQWVTHRMECGMKNVEPTRSRLRQNSGERWSTKAAAPNSGEFGYIAEYRTPHSPVIELRNVSVSHGGNTILNDITWTVHAGERWAVLGPNGSGKTTLLSLLCGDHPQAYSSDVRLFGRRRGSGESIWEVKRNVGLVSPELHLYFTQPLTADRAIATGFFDVLTDQHTSAEQDAAVRGLMAEFGITHLARRSFRTLSTGEQRLVLFARAVVKRPPLLILDEPFQGLDDATMSHLRDWLDVSLRPDQTLLFVSHLENEIPQSVNHRLLLENGKVVPTE
jgi:molybdate transport system ATP-binding protein